MHRALQLVGRLLCARAAQFSINVSRASLAADLAGACATRNHDALRAPWRPGAANLVAGETMRLMNL
jgi:hypothetical protein